MVLADLASVEKREKVWNAKEGKKREGYWIKERYTALCSVSS